MGVRRLESFLEKHCPEACYEVNIGDIANDYRNLHGNDPVIVVDGLSCIRTLYHDLDWVCGGQLKEFENLVKNFIKKFKDLGINLVVYFDGCTQEEKRSLWVRRRYSQMDQALLVIEDLRKSPSQEKIDYYDSFILPTGVVNSMYSVAKEECMVRRSLRECDKEIAEFAQKNNCMAILAQDTDFVIYELNAKYLSGKNLNLHTMSTLCYDGMALAEHLHLDVKDLPLLAFMMGNDSTTFDEMKNFHYKICGKVGRNQSFVNALVHKLAGYIHQQCKGQRLFSILPHLSRKIFGTPHRAADLQSSILSYAVSGASDSAPQFSNNEWGKILTIAYQDYVEMSAPPSVFSILYHFRFEMSTGLEDYKEIPATSNILQPIRQRVYGFILRDNPKALKDSEIVVEEYCMSGPGSLDNVSKVKAVLPLERFPRLIDMWQVQSESISATKLSALVWMSAPSLSPANVAKLPPSLVAPACVLSFLFHDVKLLQRWEVRLLAGVAVDMQTINSDELSRIQIAVVDVRGLHIALLFSRALTHISLANSACGYPVPRELVKHSSLFDGKLIQSRYSTAKQPYYPDMKMESLDNYILLCDAVLD